MANDKPWTPSTEPSATSVTMPNVHPAKIPILWGKAMVQYISTIRFQLGRHQTRKSGRGNKVKIIAITKLAIMTRVPLDVEILN